MPIEQRRTQLLDTALEIVTDKGVSFATMDAVADHAGVTKPVVYGVFANREELLEALLQREQLAAVDELLDLLRTIGAARLPTNDLQNFVEDLFVGFLSIVAAHPRRWQVILHPLSYAPSELRAAVTSARTSVIAFGEDYVAHMLASLDAPSSIEPHLLTHALANLMEMAGRLHLSDPGSYPASRFTDTIAGLGDFGSRH